MPLKHLQHIQHVQHPLIYFCNIKMKQLQHPSETSETLKTYICNIGEGKAGLVDFGHQDQSQRAAAHE